MIEKKAHNSFDSKPEIGSKLMYQNAHQHSAYSGMINKLQLAHKNPKIYAVEITKRQYPMTVWRLLKKKNCSNQSVNFYNAALKIY